MLGNVGQPKVRNIYHSCSSCHFNAAAPPTPYPYSKLQPSLCAPTPPTHQHLLCLPRHLNPLTSLPLQPPLLYHPNSAPHPLGSASASRELLQGKLPKLDLPPITEFLPPLESTNLMPLNAFLNKTGLPSWDELGLPPISELMRPVGGPRPIMAKFPSRAEVGAG